MAVSVHHLEDALVPLDGLVLTAEQVHMYVYTYVLACVPKINDRLYYIIVRYKQVRTDLLGL